MRAGKQTWLIAVLIVLVGYSLAHAQKRINPTSNENTQAPAKLINAAQQYKASSKELLTIQEDAITTATAKLNELRTLVSEGLVAKAELANSEQKLSALRAQLEITKKQISDSDNVIAEVQAEQELAKTQAAKPVKLVSKQYATLNGTATMLRYNGLTSWSPGGLDQVQAFFSGKFGRTLPTSAVGQSATHNRLGYDHHNAVDVALNPDSSEGQALIKYLKGQGIPFLAFRSAIPGVATGPHIHIGIPSHKVS
jgi:chromosome segregation ATPase